METQACDDVSIDSQSYRRRSLYGSYIASPPVGNGFAFCNLVSTALGSPGESYSRSLLSTRNGYPIFDVAGDWTRSPLHLSRGPSLGDVGFIDGVDNRFIMMFNIFADANDPIHRNHTPPKFRPMTFLEPAEVTRIPNFFPAGTVIASKGVNIHRISDSTLEFTATVTTSVREGGILVLPDGASREDLHSDFDLPFYVQENARKWYLSIANMTRGSFGIIPNGLLYLITGTDKAPAASCVAIPSTPERSRTAFEIRYKRNRPETWSESEYVRALTYDREENPGAKYGVFLRGIRISLNHRTWAKLPYYTSPELTPHYNLLRSIGLLSRILRMIEPLDTSRSTTHTGGPQVPFHFSDIIAQVILLRFPHSKVVLVDDSVWMNHVDPVSGYSTLSEIRKLITRVLVTHHFVLFDKSTRLEPTTRPTGPLLTAIIEFRKKWPAKRKVKQVLNDRHLEIPRGWERKPRAERRTK